MITKIYAVWVYVSDLQRSKDFYIQQMGFRMKFQQEDWIEFDLGETSFAILRRPLSKGAVKPQKNRIMFETNNIENFYKRAMECKIKLITSIREESYGKLFTIEDPDGHWIEIFENKKSE